MNEVRRFRVASRIARVSSGEGMSSAFSMIHSMFFTAFMMRERAASASPKRSSEKSSGLLYWVCRISIRSTAGFVVSSTSRRSRKLPSDLLIFSELIWSMPECNQ